MNNDNIENEGEFSLYTETIVQSPFEKYKKQLEDDYKARVARAEKEGE